MHTTTVPPTGGVLANESADKPKLNIGDAVFMVVKGIYAEDILLLKKTYEGKLDKNIWHKYIFGNLNNNNFFIVRKLSESFSYYIVKTNYIGYIKSLPKYLNSGTIEERSYKIKWEFRLADEELFSGGSKVIENYMLEENLIPLREIIKLTPDEVFEEIKQNGSQ